MKLSYRNERNAKFIAEQYRKPLDKPDWFKVENVASETGEVSAEILIYDYIGWPFNDPSEFIATLASLSDSEVKVRINSPGGDVFDAVAVFNAIKEHPKPVTTRVDSIAASAASYIFVAGHKKEMFKNATLMIHEPMTGMYGNQYEFAEVQAVLKQISDTMVDMYADNTNVGKRELRDMLKVETWLKPKDALAKGFTDTIIKAGSPVKAAFDLSMFASVPDELKPPAEPNIRNAESALREVCGLSLNEAKAVLARGWKAVGEETITDTEGDDETLSAAVSALNKFKI